MVAVYSSVAGKIAIMSILRAFALSAYKKPETSFYTKFYNDVCPFKKKWISSGLEFYRVGKLSLENDRQNTNFDFDVAI